MTLTATLATQMLEAGFSATEVEAMVLCECGYGEPALYPFHGALVCGSCWVEGQEI